jgi:hypothetical protein
MTVLFSVTVFRNGRPKMAKRFIDTELLLNPWVRSLPPDEKLLWVAIFTRCDNAGVWTVDWDMMKLLVSPSLDPQKVLARFSGRFMELDGGLRWFIPSFIEFQYPKGLQEKNPAHFNVFKTLRKYSIDPLKPLGRPLEGTKDMVMGMEEGKVMEEAKETPTKNAPISSQENPETMTAEEMAGLRANMEKFGLTNPNKMPPAKMAPPDESRSFLEQVINRWPNKHGFQENQHYKLLTLLSRHIAKIGSEDMQRAIDLEIEYCELTKSPCFKFYNYLSEAHYNDSLKLRRSDIDAHLAKAKIRATKSDDDSGYPQTFVLDLWDKLDAKARIEYKTVLASHGFSAEYGPLTRAKESRIGIIAFTRKGEKWPTIR